MLLPINPSVWFIKFYYFDIIKYVRYNSNIEHRFNANFRLGKVVMIAYVYNKEGWLTPFFIFAIFIVIHAVNVYLKRPDL